ncbi:MAG: hypothetical protein V8R98_06490 [Holdemanella sp.]
MPLAAVKQEQITEAFRSYLRKFAVPPYANDDARHLINGFANDLGLPEDNDFTVFTLISMTRRGSTIETHDAVSETSLLHEYVDLVVQVDCYSADRFAARDRAQAYELAGRSTYGADHFRAYGLDLQYVDGLQNLTAPTDSGRYVPRWAVTFHLGFKRTLKIDQDGFRFVEVDLANVDVKFKPKEKQ